MKLFLIGVYVPVKVGSDRTNAEGKWKVNTDLEPGRYFAKTKKAKVDDGDSKLTCKADESKAKRI